MKRVGKKVLAAAAATLRPVKQRKCGHTAAKPDIDCEYCRKQDYYIKRRRKKLPGRKVALTPSEAASILASLPRPSTIKRVCGHTASTSNCQACQAADALMARVQAHYKRKKDPNFVPGSVPLGRRIKKTYHSGPCTSEVLCSICWEREYNREWRASRGNTELLEQLKERAAQRRAALKELRRINLKSLPRRQAELKERTEKRRNKHVEYAREQRRRRYQELVATPEGREKIKKRNREYYLRKKAMQERKAGNEGE